jgi:hypothetical protein
MSFRISRICLSFLLVVSEISSSLAARIEQNGILERGQIVLCLVVLPRLAATDRSVEKDLQAVDSGLAAQVKHDLVPDRV